MKSCTKREEMIKKDGKPKGNPGGAQMSLTSKHQHEFKSHSYSIYDHDDPNSVWTRCHPKNREALDSLPIHLRTWEEAALSKKVEKRITLKDKQIRLSFWREYNFSLDMNTMMSTERIVRGIASKTYWYDYLIKDPLKLAWVLYPPSDYSSQLNEMLDVSLQGLREIITANIYDKRGKLMTAVVNSKLRAHKMIEDRVMGVNPQRLQVQQQNYNYNVNKNISGEGEKDVVSPDKFNTESEIDAEIRRVQAKIKSTPKVIAASSSNDDEGVIDVTRLSKLAKEKVPTAHTLEDYTVDTDGNSDK